MASKEAQPSVARLLGKVVALGALGFAAAAAGARLLNWKAEEWTGWADWGPTSLAAFAGLWYFEQLALSVLNLGAKFVDSIATDTLAKRKCLARHCMDTTALYGVAIIGGDMAMKLDLATIPATPYDRLYIDLAEFEFLCVCMLAFQMKNLADSFIWKDPIIYIAHHLVCVFVAWGALDGHFLHLYGIFFFGVSEVSTAVLSDHGVEELSEIFPVSKLLIGAVFIVLFISIRIVIWPYLAWKLWLDAKVVLDAGATSNAPWIVWSFIGCLAGLTCLQFLWLGEIFVRIKEEFGPKKTKAA